MRHSIWFPHASHDEPTPHENDRPGALPGVTVTPTSSPRRRRAVASPTTRLRVRSYCAFAALVIVFSSSIHLLAGAIARDGTAASVGAVGICIATAIILTLVTTRGARD